MLSDNFNQKYYPSPPIKKDSSTGGYYSDEQKLEAAKLYLVTGNTTQTAAALGISTATLKLWKNTDWWKDIINELKSQSTLQLSSKLRVIALKALSQVEDRIENGDYFWNNETQTLERIPVKARDLHRITIDMVTKSVQLENTPLAEENQKQMTDKLAALQASFEKFANKQKQISVTDVILGKDTTDAFSEKREEGLPAGSGVGKEAPEWKEVT